MSDHHLSAPQQGKRRAGAPSGRNPRVSLYLHAVTEEQAALLTDTENTSPLQEVKKKSGADTELDSSPSPVSGMRVVIIRGIPSQIEAAVRLINQTTRTKDTFLQQVQTFWLQWVEAAFPDLDSRAYFLPPVYFNRVPMTKKKTAGQDVLVLESAPGQAGQSNPPTVSPSTAAPLPCVQDSDVRDDSAMQRIFVCLQSMCEQNGEVLIGMTRLQFDQYLGEPCYSAAGAQLPGSHNLPPGLPQNWKRGDFDVLLIHRHYGVIVCEVKTFGDNIKTLSMPEEDISQQIGKKLKQAVQQLDKAEAMLSHLVSDIAPGLRITKTIAFPNLTARQLQQAVSDDTQLSQVGIVKTKSKTLSMSTRNRPR
ncbi:uncharacterized protein LOC112574810 isoform X2 [Pomacea canaliculata]|uniref:uncharacterized protein LOC112574810 isoform X2 n=1 Tax=Pomacea canaliculata TaxID=400727 RepID=UPI000D731695|nr:uncharacterized protein LOC112574810 isoform X2 [Pomacea canaliculata]